MLSAYADKYGPVALNQGARTLTEQAKFYATYLREGHPLAARPWSGAPHIKWRKQHHALDIDAGTNAGQAQSVAAFYRRHGVPVAFNVNGEPWHMDTLSLSKLLAAAKKVSGHEHTLLRFGSRGSLVLHAKRLLHNWGLKGINTRNPLFGLGTRAAVKRLQAKHGLDVTGVIGPKTWKLLERKR